MDRSEQAAEARVRSSVVLTRARIAKLEAREARLAEHVHSDAHYQRMLAGWISGALAEARGDLKRLSATPIA